MSKAEELASKEWSDLGFCNNEQSNAFKLGYLKGYHQAEKDLELTWEDVKLLQGISHEVFIEVANGCIDYYQIYPTEQSFLEEVLKRFKEQRT